MRMDEKRLNRLESTIKMEVCPGCSHERYNCRGTCERPGIDAPVTCDRCWHMTPENIDYDRRWKRYYCKVGDTDRNTESQETVRLEKKMKMHFRGYLVEA